MKNGKIIRHGLMVQLDAPRTSDNKPSAGLFYRGKRVGTFKSMKAAEEYADAEFPPEAKAEGED